ncbi:MAG: helix-turn-helix transcriptional regulator [Dermatophilaceae bacterium]
MILLRREMGRALRECRTGQGRTLRDISSSASVSLGYLSEIERGEKEASSELLASICLALDVSLSRLLKRVAECAAAAEHRTAVCAPVPLPVPSRRLASRDVNASAA